MLNNSVMNVDLVADPLAGEHLQGVLVERTARHDVRRKMADSAARVLVNSLAAAGKNRIDAVVDHVIEDHRGVEHDLRGQRFGEVVELHIVITKCGF